MLFPNCIYNKLKGKWCIVIEDKESGDMKYAVYDEEPVSDLRKIERIFYNEKDK